MLTYNFTLRLSGQAIAIPLSATVTARLFELGGSVPLTNPVPLSSSAIGAAWAVGKVVVKLPDEEVKNIPSQDALLIVSVTDGGVLREWQFLLDAAAIVVADSTSLFRRDLIVSKFRAERLQSVGRYIGTASDDQIWSMLEAAEADAQRELHVYFRPTAFFPNDPTQAEIDALAGKPWAVDPGYDYTEDMIQPGGWTFLPLRQRPVIALESLTFTHPSMGKFFTIPLQWVKIDKKYGHIRFLPTNNAFVPTLGGLMVGALGMNSAPQYLEVRYTAGLKNAVAEYPDLVDLVQRMAVLRMLSGAAIPASSSISADGLSQSNSAPDLEKMQAGIDKSLETLRQRIHGIPLMVL
jgi:hypothetical protein